MAIILTSTGILFYDCSSRETHTTWIQRLAPAPPSREAVLVIPAVPTRAFKCRDCAGEVRIPASRTQIEIVGVPIAPLTCVHSIFIVYVFFDLMDPSDPPLSVGGRSPGTAGKISDVPRARICGRPHTA